MQLHELQPKHKLKKSRRIGRGGKRGTYSGRGLKGQKAHAGRRLEPVIRRLIKRYPKLRGYKFKSKNQNQKSKVVILNLGVIDKNFKSSEFVTPKVLLEKKIIHKIKGRMPGVKILGQGKITKSVTVDGCQVSKSAREKIEKANGVVK